MPIAAFGLIDELSGEAIRREIAASRVDFYLVTSFWEAFAPGINLKWSRPLRFRKANAKRIPNEKGVYAFSIRASNSLLPAHRLIFYIGQAGGESSSKNTLRKRFGGYFNDRRPRLTRFLEGYCNQIDYQYCTLDLDGADIKALEKQLNDVLQPPANQNDFSIKVGYARKANLQ